MLIPKKNRQLIYSQLFKEGVLVAKKDFNAPKHTEIEVPNLEVIKAMQSLVSKGLARQKFAWRHFYWYLTDDGINYLREYLHLPAEVVPNTQKKTARPAGRPGAPEGRPERAERGPRTGGERDSYRRDGPSGEKKLGAGEGFNPEYRGGFAGSRGFGGDSGAAAPAGRGRPQ